MNRANLSPAPDAELQAAWAVHNDDMESEISGRTAPLKYRFVGWVQVQLKVANTALRGIPAAAFMVAWCAVE